MLDFYKIWQKLTTPECGVRIIIDRADTYYPWVAEESKTVPTRKVCLLTLKLNIKMTKIQGQKFDDKWAFPGTFWLDTIKIK